MKKYIALFLVLICVFGLAGCTKRQSAEEDAWKNLSGIEIDEMPDLESNPGVGVEIAFESENMLVFYGDFGLFGYDLNAKEIMFSVDFVKAVGIEGSVQGSHGTAVDVSDDGNTIVISEYNVETQTRGTACYIDVSAQTYTYGEYKELDNAFLKENVKGYIFTGAKIGTLKYVLDNDEWNLFS